MSRDLGIDTLVSETNDGGSIFYSQKQVKTKNVTIGSGQSLTRGTCLGKKTSDSKYYKYNKNASDGTETFAGVLTEDIDASSSDEQADIYIEGEFNADNLTATYTVEAGTFFNEYCNINIKEEV